MPLKPEIATVGITGGLNVKVDPKALAQPQVTTADNVVHQSVGLVRKRYGLTALSPTLANSTSISVTQALVLQNVSGELCLADGVNFYTYSSLTGVWQNKGKDSPFGASAVPAYSTSLKQTYANQFGNTTFADYGNYRCVAMDNGPTAFYPGAPNNTLQIGIWDKTKNTWLTPPSANTAYANTLTCGPVVVTFGHFFYVFFMTNGSPQSAGAVQYQCYVIDANSLTNGFSYTTAFRVADAYNNTGPQIGAPTSRYYIDAAATPSTVIAVYGIDFTNDSATTALGPATSYAVFTSNPGSVPNAPIAGGIYYGGTDTKMTGRQTVAAAGNYALFVGTYTTAATALDFTTGSVTPIVKLNFDPLYSTLNVGAFGPAGTTCMVVACTESGADAKVQTSSFILGTITATPNITLTVQTATTTYPWQNRPGGNYPVSKPMWNSTLSDFEIWNVTLGQVYAGVQPTLSLQALTTRRVQARVAYNASVAPNTLTPNTSLPNMITTTREVPALSNNTLQFFAVPTVGPKQILPLGSNAALVTGAQPVYYDGVTTRTLGYNGFPELSTTITSTTVGSLTASTQYVYCVVYRQFDATGRVMLSSPSNFVTGTTAATTSGQANILVFGTTTAGLPTYDGVYQAVLYRNTANDALNFHEIGLLPLNGVTTTYADTMSDATLSANALLYSPPNGGELPNDPPPACSLVAATLQRIFVNSTEYPSRVFFSKPLSPDRVPEFNADSWMDIDPPTGPITALAVIDSNVIVFKALGIYLLTGQGPDANGAGSFNPVSKISSDTGCLSAQSVIQSAQGVYFQSNRGIQLLDRSLITQYIGAPVESLIQGATVTASLLLSANSQVRFFLQNGTALVYDYLLQKWSTFSSPNGYYANSATVWNGNQVTLDNVNGKINQEVANSFTDNGSTYAMTIETPWIQFAANQSWNRLRRVAVLGDYKSSNTATLSFAYDWQSSYIDTVTFNSATGLVNGDTVYQWRARAPRQVMQAVRLKLVDSSTAGESYDLASFELEWSSRGGMARLPGQKSV